MAIAPRQGPIGRHPRPRALAIGERALYASGSLAAFLGLRSAVTEYLPTMIFSREIGAYGRLGAVALAASRVRGRSTTRWPSFEDGHSATNTRPRGDPNCFELPGSPAPPDPRGSAAVNVTPGPDRGLEAGAYWRLTQALDARRRLM
jgi:hypothetical protein